MYLFKAHLVDAVPLGGVEDDGIETFFEEGLGPRLVRVPRPNGGAAEESPFRIQRWRPMRLTPIGATMAPIVNPIAAKESATLNPANPAALSAGSLNVFRSSNNAVKVNAVIPPR